MSKEKITKDNTKEQKVEEVKKKKNACDDTQETRQKEGDEGAHPHEALLVGALVAADSHCHANEYDRSHQGSERCHP